MKILSASQIKAWDQYTISHEPVSSIDLMERAANACVAWITAQQWTARSFLIFCGKGNNGGDGLAIARLLSKEKWDVHVYILEASKKGSDDFEQNLNRLKEETAVPVNLIDDALALPTIVPGSIIIDALFGTGLSKPLTGLAASLVTCLNDSAAITISIDLPGGLFADQSSRGYKVVNATYTLSFQIPKLALLMQENADSIGKVIVRDIKLANEFISTVAVVAELITLPLVKNNFKARNPFSHKGSFGHALLAGGSYGKIGAMVLATRACLHSGAGLTTVLLPKCGYVVMQSSAPEAMVLPDENEHFLTTLPDDIEKFSAIGIGPGMGTHSETQQLLSYFIRRSVKPLVMDADALNGIAQQPTLLTQLPPYSILTPHPKEFDRLFGVSENDFSRMALAQQKAVALKLIIILKSHHTCIALPGGETFFNTTGNSGMAKGGSGDVLTGIITSLLAQGYAPDKAAIIGVYIHGWAGDIAAEKFSQQAMLPSHLIASLPEVFKVLEQSGKL